ncbi:hypothetical protein SDJN03_08066, partial [Cucurbita argyrosperma subsp. sororia]
MTWRNRSGGWRSTPWAELTGFVKTHNNKPDIFHVIVMLLKRHVAKLWSLLLLSPFPHGFGKLTRREMTWTSKRIPPHQSVAVVESISENGVRGRCRRVRGLSATPLIIDD